MRLMCGALALRCVRYFSTGSRRTRATPTRPSVLGSAAETSGVCVRERECVCMCVCVCLNVETQFKTHTHSLSLTHTHTHTHTHTLSLSLTHTHTHTHSLSLSRHQLTSLVCRHARVPGMPDQLYALLLRCWMEEPEDRPTFPQLRQELIHLVRTEQHSVLCCSKGLVGVACCAAKRRCADLPRVFTYTRAQRPMHMVTLLVMLCCSVAFCFWLPLSSD